MTAEIVTPIARGAKARTRIEPVTERITPRRAAELLTLNHSNRHIRKSVVDRYVQDMASGRWEFNGAPIIISDTNILLDGQHRLTALVEAGVALDFTVIYDAPEHLRFTVDQGAARKPGDILAFAGYAEPGSVASIAKMVMSREGGLTTISGYRPSNTSIRDWVDRNPDVADAAEIYRIARRQTPANPTVVATAWYLCNRVDAEHAHDFFVRRFIGMEGLTADDPVKALIKRLKEMSSRDSAAAKGEQLRYIILAWNGDRDGKRLTKLQAPKGGWTRNNFPEPK